MSSANECSLSKVDARNVVIFISDALRWQNLPEKVREKGVTYKTVAQSIGTNTSVPSILTGRYPPYHRMAAFSHQIPSEIKSVFDHPELDVTYDTLNTWWKEASPIYDMFGIDQSRKLTHLSEPFIFVLHDKGGHVPHKGQGFPDFKHRSALLAAYEQSVAESAQRFVEFLAELEEHNLRNEMLVVFMSDHGELLGEMGFYGHGVPMCPELVYVPMTFVHPELPSNEHVDSGVAEHVDLLPTIYEALGVSGQELDGQSLFSSELGSYGLSFVDVHHQKNLLNHGYIAQGYFEYNSGYVFHKASIFKRIFHFLLDRRYGQSLSPRWKHVFSLNIFQQFRRYTANSVSYGDPKVATEKAKSLLNDITEGADQQRLETELDDETKEAMKDLGYL